MDTLSIPATSFQCSISRLESRFYQWYRKVGVIVIEKLTYTNTHFMFGTIINNAINLIKNQTIEQ